MSIKEHDSTLMRFYGVKSLKDLPGAGSECRINPGKEGSPFFVNSIDTDMPVAKIFDLSFNP